jgi:dimethylhistidine N-methyltransferase
LSKPGQKELPSRYLYDEVGSALFEAITLLPEYGLTRADERLLRAHARAILERLDGQVILTELGSGTGKKTRWIVDALAHRGPVIYYPIDTSAAMLVKCRQEFAVAGTVAVVGVETSYLEGLREVAARRQPGQRLLVLFLGSTIGNFERHAGEAFLREVRGCLAPGDALLLGADLVKPLPDLLAAYDDATGVTAAFNLNLLARINRELDGDFVLRQFQHLARYSREAERVEMHLVSKERQTVSIRAAAFSVELRAGETIWTEASHKFRSGDLPALARRCGFVPQAQWVDAEWAFSENLWLAAPPA